MRLKALLFGGFLLAAPPLLASWEEQIKEAMLAQKKGQMKAAEEHLLRAMFTAEKFGEQDLRLAYTLDYLGLFYLNRDEPADAKKAFERALKGFEASKGPESLEALAEAGRAAEACERLKQWAEAEAYYRRILGVRLKDPKASSVAVAMDHSNLGLMLDAQGKYDEAMQEYARAKELRQAMAPESVELAETLSNQARVLYMQGKLEASELLFRQALAMDEKVAGMDDALVADDLRRLSPVLRKAGKAAEADACEARAKAIDARIVKARKKGKSKKP